MRVSTAVKAALRSNQPTPEQYQAITHPAVPLAVIAGAGSGKTAIMAARMVWMVEEEIVAPEQILGLTFTNKAARELEERIVLAFHEMDPKPEELPVVSTYNSFADRIVRENGVRIGIDPEAALLSRAQSWQLVAEALNLVAPFDVIDSRSTASLSRQALALADQCDNNLVTPEEVADEDARILQRGEGFYDEDVLVNSKRRRELAVLVRAYMDLKKARRCIDYGDQVTKAVEILEGFEDVRGALRERFPAILLDEYQDTNVAQRKMLQALAPWGSNVTAVGDARQNIFQWRGSTLFNLIDFPTKHFLRTGGEEHQFLSLPDNFRSGRRILGVANTVIEKIPEERRPGLGVRAVPEGGEGFVGTRLFSDQTEEAAFIAEEIKRLHGTSTADGRPPVDWRDCAILVRRRAMMGPIYSVLTEEGIPVEVIGLGGLLQVPEVVETISWLRLIADPGPSSNRWVARILMGPRFRVHYRDLAVLARWAADRTKRLAEAKREGIPDRAEAVVPDETEFEPEEVAFSLTESLDHLDEIDELGPVALQRLARMHSDLCELRQRRVGTLLEIVQSVLDTTGIVEELQAGARTGVTSGTANLTQFMGMVANFAPVSGEASLPEFLDYLDAAEDSDDTMEFEGSTAEDSVKLTTVHRAKGLEFEVVFVPGVAARTNDRGEKVDSVFPDERSSNPMTSASLLPYGVREDRQHLPDPFRVDERGERKLKKKSEFKDELKNRAVEDERRLFYVSLTRAKQRLYVTAAWWYERQTKPRGPSTFFDEVARSPFGEDLGVAEQPKESPLLTALASRAVWPPRTSRMADYPELPRGARAELQSLMEGAITSEDVLMRLHPEERERSLKALDGHRKLQETLSLVDGRARAKRPKPAIRSISVSDVVTLLDPLDGGESLTRPMPRRPSPAARLGSEVHRWIEEQALGLTGVADEDVLDEPGPHVESSKLSALKASFVRMGYPRRRLARLPGGEPMAELRFVLKVGDRLVKGRMDAVYELDDEGLEIVDFKTGAEAAKPELDQLMLYAVALSRLGVELPGTVNLTYCYLDSEQAVSRTIDASEIDRALKKLQERLLATG
ncbi:MAG TPA: ATP-dependent DNA helicase [Actinomycetota bacterium]|nr:ATP-dependent DNA helicase [Actinomycetota bacterium]